MILTLLHTINTESIKPGTSSCKNISSTQMHFSFTKYFCVFSRLPWWLLVMERKKSIRTSETINVMHFKSQRKRFHSWIWHTYASVFLQNESEFRKCYTFCNVLEHIFLAICQRWLMVLQSNLELIRIDCQFFNVLSGIFNLNVISCTITQVRISTV